MSKTKKPAAQSGGTEATPMDATMNIMTAFAPVHETALKAWFDMGLEAMKFMSSRMQEDIGTQQAMLTCKTAEELRQVQSDFYERALKDYRAQTSRMMELISATSQANGLGTAAKTRRGYDDVPL